MDIAVVVEARSLLARRARKIIALIKALILLALIIVTSDPAALRELAKREAKAEVREVTTFGKFGQQNRGRVEVSRSSR